MQSTVKSFFIKLLIISIPFLLLFTFYLVTDPYRVLYHYENYYTPRESQYVTLNRDLISTEMLLRNYPVYHYDSYIFGNSRSYFYSVKEWGRIINSNRCFHFNSNAESLYGFVQKLKFLDERHYNFKNALFVIDIPMLQKVTPDKGPIFLKHPIFTGQSQLDFQLEFIKAFFDPRFLFAFIDLKITGKWKSYMKIVLSDRLFNYEIKTNELAMNAEERKIKSDSTAYYERKTKKKNIFFKRSETEVVSPVVIKEPQLKLLSEASSILKKHRVNFRFIISPIYDQVKMNPADLAQLDSLFGAQNVFDFSGRNEFTDPVGNYYENSHYRPEVALRLLEIAYSKR